MMATPAALSFGKRTFPLRLPFLILIGSAMMKDLFLD
jgi:hypothetical protein